MSDLWVVSGGPDASKNATNQPKFARGRLAALKILEERVQALPGKHAAARGNTAFRTFAEGSISSLNWEGYRVDAVPEEIK